MTAQLSDSQPPGEMYCPSCEKTFANVEYCPDDGGRLVRLGQQDPFIGRQLDGRYTILERIGRGGMGMVYRAEQHSVDREVAIKVVGSGWATDPDMIKRFLREAKLASRLSHPNAVSVLDFGQTSDGVFYLVMELVTGLTLDAVLSDEPIFAPERVIRIGIQICEALEQAHALSIIHRDLKPANIMVMSPGRDFVKVLDFGLAKSLSPDQTSTTMTGAGAMLGTPAFMPPELATGQPCDGRADLYSLGCILFLIGTGHLPFESESVHELIAAHGSERAPPMTGVPASLATIVGRLLEKLPADRFQSAAATRAALESCLDLTRTPIPGATLVPVRSALASAATLPPQPVPRRRRYWPVVILAASAIAAGTVIWVANDTPTPSPVIAPAQPPVVVPPPSHVDPPPHVDTPADPPKPIVTDPIVAEPKPPPADPKIHRPTPKLLPVPKVSAAPLPAPVEIKTVPAETAPPPPPPTAPPPPAKTDLPF